MFRAVLRPQIIKRFCHTHSKTVIKENKKTIEDLLIETKKQLDDANTMLLRIEDEVKVVQYVIIWSGFCILMKR